MPGVGSRVEEIAGRAYRTPRQRLAGRAYRTPRQRLRISTASFIGCREEISGRHGRLHPCRKSPSRLPRSRDHAGCREAARGDRRARLSDAAPAASDKHCLLHRMSRRDFRSTWAPASLSEVAFATSPPPSSDVAKGRPGSGSWLNPYRKSSSRLRIRSHVAPGARPLPGRAYRTPRQRLRISTASFIGCREGPSWVRIVARSLSEVVLATSHPQPCRTGSPPATRARLSDAAPAASDKHRLLHRKSRRAVLDPDRGSIPIGSRLRDCTSAAMSHREPARIPGRAYRTPRQRLRISTASFIGCREGPFWVQIVAQSPIESRLRDFR